ncbi:hypothetical protein ON010_g9783 [Phytophthora cinnamomi]|nr:hypothetical protein ON010_g9783 [Phytophthora cinnamomi]
MGCWPSFGFASFEVRVAWNEVGYLLLRWVVELDETHIHGSTQDSAHERAQDRDPEVSAVRREHLPAPAAEERKEAWAEVTSRVESVAGVEAERHADAREQETHRTRKAVGARRFVDLVTQRKDATDQQSRTDDLVGEGGPVRDLWIRVRGEDALRELPLRVHDVEPRVVDDVEY